MRSWLLPLLLVAVGAAGCGGGSDTAAPDTTETTVQAGACRAVDLPAAKDEGDEKAPAARLDPERVYRLVVSTNCGSFTITLDQAQSPATAASLVSLTRAGYFDSTIFHRVVVGALIQGGDPTQSGSGGPGYSTTDTPPSDARYTTGVVAMAKTELEAPGTSGSQFFIVTGADLQLPPDYAIVGTVTKGIATVNEIGTHGDPATEEATAPLVIDKARVVEGP